MRMVNKTNKKQLGEIKFWLIVLILVLGGVWLLFFDAPIEQYISKAKYYLEHINTEAEQIASLESNKVRANATTGGCSSHHPKHGKVVLFSEENFAVEEQAIFYANNEHLYPILLSFIDSNTAEPIAAVYLDAGKDQQITMPIGTYFLELQSGTEWCNFNDGFKEGAVIDTDKLIYIEDSQVSNIHISSFDDGMSDVMLSFVNTVGVVNKQARGIEGHGSLVLKRMPNGHYNTRGSINGLPVHFIVDTGASISSFSPEFAKQAGIYECQKGKIRTANGVVDSCKAKAKELTIGQFKLRNIDVSYNKGMGNTFLLGMNVIGLFKMEQQGDVMRLSR